MFLLKTTAITWTCAAWKSTHECNLNSWQVFNSNKYHTIDNYNKCNIDTWLKMFLCNLFWGYTAQPIFILAVVTDQVGILFSVGGPSLGIPSAPSVCSPFPSVLQLPLLSNQCALPSAIMPVVPVFFTTTLSTLICLLAHFHHQVCNTNHVKHKEGRFQPLLNEESLIFKALYLRSSRVSQLMHAPLCFCAINTPTSSFSVFPSIWWFCTTFQNQHWPIIHWMAQVCMSTSLLVNKT